MAMVALKARPKTARRVPRHLVGAIPSVLILLAFVVLAIGADLFAPFNPTKIDLASSLLPPSWLAGAPEHLLGTDQMGRDLLTRIIYGARVSLGVSFIAVFIGGSVGTSLGVLAGYRGGWVDAFISRTVDVMLGFPTILIALLLAIRLGPSFTNVILVIVLVIWARYARQARAETLKIRELDFVTLARTAGCSPVTIMVRHVLPNVLNSIIVLASLQVGWVITLEATLSFLGAGIPPPNPSWGVMVSDGREFITSAWWVAFFPGVSIMLTVLAGNLFGDWLRDRLDPKLREL